MRSRHRHCHHCEASQDGTRREALSIRDSRQLASDARDIGTSLPDSTATASKIAQCPRQRPLFSFARAARRLQD